MIHIRFFSGACVSIYENYIPIPDDATMGLLRSTPLDSNIFLSLSDDLTSFVSWSTTEWNGMLIEPGMCPGLAPTG